MTDDWVVDWEKVTSLRELADRASWVQTASVIGAVIFAPFIFILPNPAASLFFVFAVACLGVDFGLWLYRLNVEDMIFEEIYGFSKEEVEET